MQHPHPSVFTVTLLSLWSLPLPMTLPSTHSAAISEVETLSLINPEGKNIASRFNPPSDFFRKDLDKNSFGYYLRNLPLKEDGALVKLYDGSDKGMAVYDAVVDMDIGNKDLQQCADAIMRLRGEYYYSLKQFDKISFKLTNGFKMDYAEWMKGNRLAVNGNKTWWVKSADASNSYSVFRKYMEVVFSYAGTLSLARNLHPKNIDDIAIGDVFVHGGSPGHAVIIVDVAESKTGEKIFMVAQSYMPAQDIHILKNYNEETISPWYKNNVRELNTPQWNFEISGLKSFD